MKSIKEIQDINKVYIEAKRLLSEEYIATSEANSLISLEEVNRTLNYKETKELLDLISSCCRDKDVLGNLKEIMDRKKIEEYPETLGVKYYPEIKTMDITEEDKISLDRKVKEAFRNENVRVRLPELGQEVIDFLESKNILEKNYIFYCTCGSSECYKETLTQKEVDELKLYWMKLKKGTATDDEHDKMNFGCFEIGCWNDGRYEIYNLETFSEHLSGTEYRVIKKPDMTVDDM